MKKAPKNSARTKKTKKGKKQEQGITVIPLLIMVASVIAFAVMGYFVYKQMYPAKVAVNANANVAANTNVNSTANTNTVANTNTTGNTNSAVIVPNDWKTYTNATYNYSIRYPADYSVTTENTLGQSPAFYKGTNKGVRVNSVDVYSLTAANTTSSDAFGGEGSGWYTWAINGFQNDDSAIARLSDNKRRETYGGKIFTVIDFDAGSSWGGAPFYYYVDGKTVYIIVDARGNTKADVQKMLTSFTLTTSATKDWKTYTNTEYGFSLKAPESCGEGCGPTSSDINIGKIHSFVAKTTAANGREWLKETGLDNAAIAVTDTTLGGSAAVRFENTGTKNIATWKFDTANQGSASVLVMPGNIGVVAVQGGLAYIQFNDLQSTKEDFLSIVATFHFTFTD